MVRIYTGFYKYSSAAEEFSRGEGLVSGLVGWELDRGNRGTGMGRWGPRRGFGCLLPWWFRGGNGWNRVELGGCLRVGKKYFGDGAIMRFMWV